MTKCINQHGSCCLPEAVAASFSPGVKMTSQETAITCDIKLENTMTLYHPYLFIIVDRKQAVISNI